MRRLRVLIVDDSVVARRLISDMILSDPALEVAGIAHHGHIALAKIPQVTPDLITLDVDMPEMNGFETLIRLRRQYPHIPVIMLSGLTEEAAKLTLEALALGASDYVSKPTSVGIDAMDQSHVRQELISKIKALCAKKLVANVPADPDAGEAPRLDVVVIGVSTGGPNALSNILPQIPAMFPVPILIVQHMPPLFTRFLAERLAGQCALPVKEAVHGCKLEPGSIWIAPGDYHMVVGKAETGLQLNIHQGPPENSCRPSVDPLFRSAVECFGSHVLGVIMTGMGQDGLQGARCIHDAGGQVIVQDEASSVVWSMPKGVVEEGIADAVVPLDQLAQDICARVDVGRRTADQGQKGELVS